MSGYRLNQLGFMDVRIVAGRIVLYRACLVSLLYRACLVSLSLIPQLSRDGLADSGFICDKTAVVCATIKERLCSLKEHNFDNQDREKEATYLE
jgi:hypothetical protein